MDNKLIKQIQGYFENQPVTKVYLFGSFSRGEETPDSDVDLIVVFDEKAHVSLIGYVRIKRQLEKLIGREVDLVEEGSLLPFAQITADRDKMLIYEKHS